MCEIWHGNDFRWGDGGGAMEMREHCVRVGGGGRTCHKGTCGWCTVPPVLACMNTAGGTTVALLTHE